MGLFRSVTALFAALATLSFPAPARASEWWFVNTGPNRVLFIDAQSLVRKHDRVSYWAMYVFGPGADQATMKTHMQADCASRRIRFLAEFRYDLRGSPIGTSPSRPGPMQTVPPDSLGDAEMHFACGGESDRAANDQFALAMDPEAFAKALIERGNKPERAHAIHDELVGRSTPGPQGQASRLPAASPSPEEPVDHASAPDNDQDGVETNICDTDPADDVCRMLAERYADGDDVARDAVRAALLFGKSCESGNADACTSLAIAYRNGDGVPKDLTAAASYSAVPATGADRIAV